MMNDEEKTGKRKKPSEPLITLITLMTLIKHLSILIFGICAICAISGICGSDISLKVHLGKNLACLENSHKGTKAQRFTKRFIIKKSLVSWCLGGKVLEERKR
jgi:hypothetical protein